LTNKLRGTFERVRGKGARVWRSAQPMLQDIAVLTGGKVISEDLAVAANGRPVCMNDDLSRGDRMIADKHEF
jgi:chaperonin GroEL (HSP60 family)